MARKNHNYGKLENGKLVYAPSFVEAVIKDERGNDVRVNVFNPSDYYYRLNDYKNVVADPYPQDGNTYQELLTEDEQTIYKHWQQIDVPPTIDERIDAVEEAILDIAEMLGGMV